MIIEFENYLKSIEDKEHRLRFSLVLDRVHMEYPTLKPIIAWGMPVFTHNDTFIIGFAAFSGHFSVAPEPTAITKFTFNIAEAGYAYTKGLFKIKWTDKVDFLLLKVIIEFNLEDKAECKTFWRR